MVPRSRCSVHVDESLSAYFCMRHRVDGCLCSTTLDSYVVLLDPYVQVTMGSPFKDLVGGHPSIAPEFADLNGGR
jgi:hypothetical protein